MACPQVRGGGGAGSEKEGSLDMGLQRKGSPNHIHSHDYETRKLRLITEKSPAMAIRIL